LLYVPIPASVLVPVPVLKAGERTKKNRVNSKSFYYTVNILNPLTRNAKSCFDWAEMFSVASFSIEKISYFML
jgi:hypothetical protein